MHTHRVSRGGRGAQTTGSKTALPNVYSSWHAASPVVDTRFRVSTFLPSPRSLPVVLLYEDYRAPCNYARVFYSLSPVRRWPRAYSAGPTAFASALNAVNLSERAATRRIPRHWPEATRLVVLLFKHAVLYPLRSTTIRIARESGGEEWRIKPLILFSRGCYARDMLKILSMVGEGFLF